LSKDHPEKIDEVARQFNARGVFASGMHIEAQYKLLDEAQRSIRRKWEQTKRNIEDILMDNGYKDVKDVETQKTLDDCKYRTDQSIKQVSLITDGYFEKRNQTFLISDVEKIKQMVIKTGLND
jgi:hypothetical protein